MSNRWTEKEFISILENPKDDFMVSDSRIHMVCVDKHAYQQQSQTNSKPSAKAKIKDKDFEHPSTAIEAEILGITVYEFSAFELQVVWRIIDAEYQRSWGIATGYRDVVIEEIVVPENIKILSDKSNHRPTPEFIQRIESIFMKQHQEWKMEAMLLPIGLQPTHFSDETKWGIKDINPVKQMQIKDFAALVKHEGIHFEGCFVKENKMLEFQYMRGYATYRVASDIANTFIYLNWMVRIRQENGKTSQPEVVLIEGENIPGVVLSGMVLTDSKDQYLNVSQEIVHLLRMLNNRREWVDGCVDLLMQWFKIHNIEAHNHSKDEDDDSGQFSKQLSLFNSNARVQTYVVASDNDENLTFDGIRLARVIDSSQEGQSHILDLYQTERGNWVCSRQSIFEDKNDQDENVAKICKSETEVVHFFGLDSKAKKLYKQAKINYSRRVK